MLKNGKITIKDKIYTLVATESKRELIYINNKLVNTKAKLINL